MWPWAPACAGARRSRSRIALAALAGLSLATTAEAQPATARPASLYGDPGAPDISGLWLGTITGVPGEKFAPNRGSADGRPATYWSPYPLPYTPAFKAVQEERAAAAKRGVQLGDVSAKCLPFGLPMMLVSKVYPDEIEQTPGQVTFLMNNAFPIVIWTDGRAHPANLAPSYNGHSIGHWVGDTLFVDTVGLVGTTPIDVARNPHSADLHIRWSVQRVAADTLHLHVPPYDETAFTEPVSTINIWRAKSGPGWQVLDDASCFENNADKQDSVPGAGFVKF